jgi:hypothetical protein
MLAARATDILTTATVSRSSTGAISGAYRSGETSAKSATPLTVPVSGKQTGPRKHREPRGMCGRCPGPIYGCRVTDGSASNYLRDLGPLLMDLARTARADADRTGDAFDRGRSMDLYEAVSLVVQQADAFGFDRGDVGLDGIDPDRDLL